MTTNTNIHRPATDRQLAFLRRLIAANPAAADVENYHPDTVAAMTRRQASNAIDVMTAHGPAAGTDAPEAHRWVRHGDAWLVTGPYAEPGDLITIRKANGDTAAARIIDLHPASTTGRPLWTVERIVDAAPANPDAPTPKAGHTYAAADGTPIRVQAARGTGNLYAKVWNGAEWEYRGRAGLALIARPLTADEAAKFGHRFGTCVFCAHHLSDDREGRSVEVGYGPVCARNHGLPWG